jgi:hypothetical protein
MTIGILCEGDLTDVPVLKLFLEHLFPEHNFIFKGLPKKVIFEFADRELMLLFEQGAERALIIWDLLPVGHRMAISSQWNESPNRREQRHKLLQVLCESTLLPDKLLAQAYHLAARYGFSPYDSMLVEHPNKGDDLFKLVCVCYTADGWLLADDGVLTRLATHNGSASRCNAEDPDRCRSPEAFLKRYFGQSRHPSFRLYNKFHHNKVIARAYIQDDRVQVIIRRSTSFRRAFQIVETWIAR